MKIRVTRASGKKSLAVIMAVAFFLSTPPAFAAPWTWTAQTGSNNSFNWKAIASSADGTKLVATVQGGGDVFVSTNSGSTWTNESAAGSRDWRSVAMSSDGTHIAAAAVGGDIWISTTTGSSWIDETSPMGSKTWGAIAMSPDGTQLAASVYGGYIYLSTNSGVTWATSTAAGSRNWQLQSIAISSDGTHVAAAVDSGDVFTTANGGTSWTDQTPTPGAAGWEGITSSIDGSKIIPVSGSGGYVWISTTTGSTWTKLTAAGSRNWQSAAVSSDGTHIAAAVQPGGIFVSPDGGTTWIQTAASTTINWNDVTSSSNGAALAAVAFGNYIYTISMAPPSVATSSPTSIASSSLTLNGSITADGNASSTVEGFNYGLTSAYGSTASSSNSIDTGSFSQSITGLSCNTAYHYQAFATNFAGTGTSSDATFTTGTCPVVPPTLLTPTFSGVSATGATASSSITATGGANATVEGFNWGTDTTYSLGTTTISGSFGISAFSAATTSLSCNTTYHVRAFAANTGGTGYSSDESFLTSPCVPGSPTGAFALSGNTEAVVSFSPPASNGGAAITGYTVSSNPAGGADLNAGSAALTHHITGLSNGVSYTFTVAAANSVGASQASAGSNAIIPSAAPVIWSVFSGDPTERSATITWTTDSPGTSTVNYGTTASYGMSSSSSAFVTLHSISLSGLAASTTYHFDASSGDANGSNTSPDYTFTTDVQCTYYVDSIAGNDSNNGTSAATPFQHLAAVPAVSNGSTICLKRGSYFTDSLYVGIQGSPRNDVTVRDYGLANMPIPMIDESNDISPSAWTPVGGSYPNLYQATVTGPGPATSGGNSTTSTPYGTFGGDTPWINMWECKSAPCTGDGLGGNDHYLTNESSESSANSTPGSYYISGMTGGAGPTNGYNPTIYLSTSDGSNPATNGYAYTYGARMTGIEVDGTNDTVMNIASKKNVLNDGSIVQYQDGGDGTFSGIEALQGGKHNAFCTSGCTIDNSLFADENYSFGDMLVVFDTVGQGLPVTCNNCTFLQGPSGNSSDAAFFSHTGSGPSPATTTFNGGLLEGVNNGLINGVAPPFDAVINGFGCVNVRGCISPTGFGATTTISNSWDISTSTFIINGGWSGPFADVEYATSTVYVNDSSGCGTPEIDNHNGLSGVNLSVATSTFYFMSGNFMGNASPFGSVSLFNTILDGPNDFHIFWVDLGATSTESYSGDYNAFVASTTNPGYGAWAGSINGTNYAGLPVWQAATGQDAHSTTTGSGASACVIPTFALSGPASGNVANSATFTVTPSIAYSGTVTLSPTGSGSTGLAPVALSFNNSTSSETASFAPRVAGTITLTTTSNAASGTPTFTDPSSITYAASDAAPGSPTGVTATAGAGQATVAWSGPILNGGADVTGYTVTSSPGNITVTSTTTSVVVSGLSGGTSYNFTVMASNGAGKSPTSAPSNSVIPTAAPSSQSQQQETITAISTSGGISSPGSDSYISWFNLLPSSYQSRLISEGKGPTNGSQPAEQLSGSPFSRDLQIGSSGQEVEALQQYLNSHGFTVAPSGPGSPGNETEFFGDATKAALERFQKADGLPVTGYFGSMTLAMIAGQASTIQGEATVPIAPTKSVFSRSLQVGSTGADVQTLQQYLNSHGFTVASSGPGSPGNETEMFGDLTKAALAKFQTANGISPASGYFGSITMDFVNNDR